MRKPDPTLGLPIYTPCCDKVVWLIVRGEHGNPVTWTGVGCPGCDVTHTYEMDLSGSHVPKFAEIQAVRPLDEDGNPIDNLLTWAIPGRMNLQEPPCRS